MVVTLPLPLGDAVVEALRHCDGDGVGDGDGESVAETVLLRRVVIEGKGEALLGALCEALPAELPEYEAEEQRVPLLLGLPVPETDAAAEAEKECEALPLGDEASEALWKAEEVRVGSREEDSVVEGVREGEEDKEALEDVLGDCTPVMLSRALREG